MKSTQATPFVPGARMPQARTASVKWITPYGVFPAGSRPSESCQSAWPGSWLCGVRPVPPPSFAIPHQDGLGHRPSFGWGNSRKGNRSVFASPSKTRLLGLTLKLAEKTCEPRWTGQRHIERVRCQGSPVPATLRMPVRCRTPEPCVAKSTPERPRSPRIRRRRRPARRATARRTKRG
jgi:hypothetical protein